MSSLPAFAPEEIRTDEPTRSARLKWVVVVDSAAAPGIALNAVACVAAATGATVDGLLAHGGPDADGSQHLGLPWSGCTVLAASADEIAAVRAKAAAHPEMLVADMPAAAQTHRIYDDYLTELATTAAADIGLVAVSVVGPRNAVDRLVKRLSLV